MDIPGTDNRGRPGWALWSRVHRDHIPNLPNSPRARAVNWPDEPQRLVVQPPRPGRHPPPGRSAGSGVPRAMPAKHLSGPPDLLVGLLAQPPLGLVGRAPVEEALVFEAALVAVHDDEHAGQLVGRRAVVT